MEGKKKASSYFNNGISVLGLILSVIFFVVIASLFALDFLGKDGSVFLQLITYIIVPGFLIFSIALIFIGAFLERLRRRRGGEVPKFPRVDFNNPTHQRWAYVIWGVATLFLLFSAVGLYRAYHFTESNLFCGKLCHAVMKPEYTAYQQSTHSRVNCAQCHIGYGAEWYVRSKISGLYQVYSTLANAYSRPIESPIRSLRPAQQTCEQCHWPQTFIGIVDQDRDYFLSDEANTEWKTRMLLYVGGGTGPKARAEKKGIHWHVTGGNSMYYIATDRQRQVIPWVRVVSPDGKEEFFIDKESGYTPENPPKGEMRLMDCLDCHNRPSHKYKSPSEALNISMSHGKIDPSLPYIKREASKALVGEYASHEDAAEKIQASLESFYKQKYPRVWEEGRLKITKAIEEVVQIYKGNFFPEMKVNWKAYPNNISHLISPGCFRCHSGRHESTQGKKVSGVCSDCHDVVAQGPPGNVESKLEGLAFKHPDTGAVDEREGMLCFDCHTGE